MDEELIYKNEKMYLISNPETIDELLIEEKLNAGYEVRVQFCTAIFTDKMLAQLEKLFAKHDDNLTLRFYWGFGQFTLDCSMFAKTPSVKSLYIEMPEVENIDALQNLKHLSKLGIGIYELKDPEILRFDSFKNIHILQVTETRKSNINLEYIKDYRNLRILYLRGQSKNIKAIGHLKNIEVLHLDCIKKTTLEFINELPRLKLLSITLGGRANIDEVKSESVEDLGIVWVRGFEDKDFLSRFPALKHLHIEDEVKLEEIDFIHASKNLESIRIANCKNLKSVNGIHALINLKEISIWKTALNFDNLVKHSMPPHLKKIFFSTSKEKEDKVIRKQLAQMGFPEQAETWEHNDAKLKELVDQK